MTVKNKLYPLDIVTVKGSGAKVVSGGKLVSQYPEKIEYKEFKPEVQFCQVPGSGKVEFQFLISGKGSLEVNYESKKAGKRRSEVILK
jgi:hypothetical protein